MIVQPLTTQLSTRSSAALLGAVGTVGDPENTRTVTSIIALLVAMGLALVMLAVWLFRSTRPDPELLAPLEVMGERRWRRRDPVWQRRRLDELRPAGAEPMRRSAAPPDIDEAFDAGPAATGFDDLHADTGPDHEPDHGNDRVHPSARDTGEHRLVPPTSADARVAAPTPTELQRPSVEQLPDGEVDPEVFEAAMAELDAELGHGSEPQS